MDEPPSGLAGLQRWMHAAILDPDGIAGDAAGVISASSRLTARDRLAIYWRGYRLRLLESMRGLHPGLVHLLGEQLFDQFALDFLDARPPRAYSLFRLDEGFVDHLRRTRPDASEPPDRRQPWPDMITDLAYLERAVTEVMDGPGTEQSGVLAPDGLPSVQALPGACLVTAPCLRLPRLSFPANEYLAAMRRGDDPAPAAPRPVHLAVCRRDDALVVRELGAVAHGALEALTHGATVGIALRGVPEERALEWLRHWAALGFFTRVERFGATRISWTAGTIPAPVERTTTG
ncbi:putative DNA-binding domain-containing protein [Actinomadura sp. 9N407]|uniref:HvfC/BufC family peptide modification chaperone n=1 Tax=Actinomadura sp. 9N407 TaxID=3375154 RepID=UPI00379C4718